MASTSKSDRDTRLGTESRFLWVSGSPSAAENPPHERRWRAEVAEVAARQEAAVQVELDFLLQPERVVIDLDNLVRPALDGLRDAGTLSRGLIGLDTILATKRPAPPLGLGMSLIRSITVDAPTPIQDRVDLVVEADAIPREGNSVEKHAWRSAVRDSWLGSLSKGPVAIDIAVRTRVSLAAVVKPVIDGLEPYLGRGTIGGGEFRPRDERIVVLRVRRVMDLPVVLRVAVGPPSRSTGTRNAPPAPRLPAMDRDFSHSIDDMEGFERMRAWDRIFAMPPAWPED